MTDVASSHKGYVTKAPFQQVMSINNRKTIKKNSKLLLKYPLRVGDIYFVNLAI